MKKFFKTMKAKTKMFFAVCALALILAVAVGYGVQTSMNNDVQLSDLARANVEALAKLEAPKNPGGPTPCGGPSNDRNRCLSENTVNCKDLFGCQ